MPKRIVVTKFGDPEVLKYENYELPKKLPDTQVRIKQTSIGLNYFLILQLHYLQYALHENNTL